MVIAMPKLLDIKRGKELGKNETYKKFIFVECPLCHKRRWSREKPIHRSQYPYLRCWECLTGSGCNHAIWKGGRHFIRGYYRLRLKKDDPYFSMADTNAYIFEHRYIMAEHLGRCLKPWEIIHHKNGDKGDNRLENLEIVTHLKNISASIYDTVQSQGKRIEQLEARVILLEAENMLLLSKYNVDPL